MTTASAPYDPFTRDAQLCDDTGTVTGPYLVVINNLRAHTGLAPVYGEFMCTGHAHLAGEHIHCTSPAHHPSTTRTSIRAATAGHAYTIPVPPKSLRESLAVVQGIFLRHSDESHEPVFSRAREHLNMLINECDRKRPTGPGGKHDDRHTDECGCSSNPDELTTHVCDDCRGSGWSTRRSVGIEPQVCDTCGGRGSVPA